jgi:type VI secretion system secreted protein VgrG
MPITQANRAIKITSPFKENALLVERLSYTEQLGRPFELQLHLESEDGNLNPDTILGHEVTVSFPLPSGGGKRFFNGYVTEFAQVGYERKLHLYRATVSPWFWFLTRTSDCRIFQQKSIPDIFEEVAKGNGFSGAFKLNLKGTFEKWDYCVQYRETDFNFLSRLLEQEGAYYFFTHADGNHKMVVTNDPNTAEAIKGYDEVPYYPPGASQAQRKRDHLSAWSFARRVQPGVYATTEYDFANPKTRLLSSEPVSRKHGLATFEIFDAPAEIPKMTTAETARIAKIRIEELQSRHMVGSGSGNAAGLSAGSRFKLKEYPRSDLNMEYLVTSVVLTASSGAHTSGKADAAVEFEILVEAADIKAPWRPARITPRPSVQGPQTATVVGPSGEEIHTDKYGRVKLQFHWDRHGKEDENSSCWVSVSQPWASKNWGAVNIPRIGDEVIVAFLEGDPDRPIVIGRTYNGTHMPPYELPTKKTQTVFMSRSSRGGAVENNNEISFEDEKGKELLFLHAEKDQLIEVEHDEKHAVGNDRRKEVKNNETVSIGKNRSESVGGDEMIAIEKNRTESVKQNESVTVAKDQTVTVQGSRTRTVSKDESITIQGNRTEKVSKNEEVTVSENREHTVGKNDTLKVTKKLMIDAGDEVTIKTGSASITMKKDGTITIKGKDISLDGSGKINVKAGGDVAIKGSKVTQN